MILNKRFARAYSLRARDGSSDRQSCGRVRLPRSENIFPFYPPGFGDGAAGVPQQFPPGERSGGVAAVMISSIPPQAAALRDELTPYDDTMQSITPIERNTSIIDRVGSNTLS